MEFLCVECKESEKGKKAIILSIAVRLVSGAHVQRDWKKPTLSFRGTPRGTGSYLEKAAKQGESSVGFYDTAAAERALHQRRPSPSFRGSSRDTGSYLKEAERAGRNSVDYYDVTRAKEKLTRQPSPSFRGSSRDTGSYLKACEKKGAASVDYYDASKSMEVGQTSRGQVSFISSQGWGVFHVFCAVCLFFRVCLSSAETETPAKSLLPRQCSGYGVVLAPSRKARITVPHHLLPAPFFF